MHFLIIYNGIFYRIYSCRGKILDSQKLYTIVLEILVDFKLNDIQIIEQYRFLFVKIYEKDSVFQNIEKDKEHHYKYHYRDDQLHQGVSLFIHKELVQ